MKTIPLTKGYSTMVDDEDYEWLSRHKWCFSGSRKSNGRGYAVTTFPQRKQTFMHRLIMGFPSSMVVDHIDTITQNAQNSIGNTRRESRFKGISRNFGRWRSAITVNGVYHFLGVRDTEEEAHELYKEAARKHFGEYANYGE